MKIFKKALAIMSLALAFAPGAYASEINVGGVVFDPDYNASPEHDFVSGFTFTQWYANTSSAKGTLNNFDQAATIQSVLNSQAGGGSGATGLYLQGAGIFNRLNDPNNSFINGFGGPSTFCPGCQLTYAFGGIGLNKDSTFNVSNAWAQMYVDNKTDYQPPVNSDADAKSAIDGSVWLDLEILSLEFLSGSVQNGMVSAKLGVIGGIAEENFLPKELSYTATAFFLEFPPLAPLSAKYSSGGTGTLAGNSIPEPGSVAMLGIGLLGLAFSRRRKQES